MLVYAIEKALLKKLMKNIKEHSDDFVEKDAITAKEGMIWEKSPIHYWVDKLNIEIPRIDYPGVRSHQKIINELRGVCLNGFPYIMFDKIEHLAPSYVSSYLGIHEESLYILILVALPCSTLERVYSPPKKSALKESKLEPDKNYDFDAVAPVQDLDKSSNSSRLKLKKLDLKEFYSSLRIWSSNFFHHFLLYNLDDLKDGIELEEAFDRDSGKVDAQIVICRTNHNNVQILHPEVVQADYYMKFPIHYDLLSEQHTSTPVDEEGIINYSIIDEDEDGPLHKYNKAIQEIQLES